MENTAAPAIQHDEYGYSTSFVAGRGNVTKAIRWDVDDPNQTAKTESKIGYDVTGNVVFTRDALDHQTSMNYADEFSIDGTGPDSPRSFATFAYPTTFTDADGGYSTFWYRYDFGAKTRVQGPPPQNQSSGIVQTLVYDDAARLQRTTTQNNGGYTRYIYGPTYIQTLSTVNSVGDEAYTGQFYDGAGHLVASTRNHPGSQGGYNAVLAVYNKMGRAVQHSNPTEITGAGAPAGDDIVGYQFNVPNTFDWKGRPLRTYNMDGTFKETSYAGCGCAGGEVVTLEDEVERQQKVYSEVFGRPWKTEVLNDNGSVYSTTVSVFNARDQVKLVNQYSGVAPSDASSTNEALACPTGTCQQATMGYDGYGRLQSKHLPQQQTGTATNYFTT